MSRKAETSTHDAIYFIMGDDRQFKEMFANYVQLKKSSNGPQYIERLKDKTSPELVTAIDTYYKGLSKGTQKVA